MPSFFCSKFFFVVFVTSVGSGFQHGYHTAVLNVPEKVIKSWVTAMKIKYDEAGSVSKGEETIIWSATVAIFSVGGFLGSFLIGMFADKCGRKGSLKLNNFIILAAIAIMAYSKEAHSYQLLLLGRFMAGINASINAGICQMYLIEIAPDKIRGAIGSVYQYVFTCAMLISEFAGLALGTEEHWPFIFVVAAVPAVLQLVALPFCPESPKFLLITQGKDHEAEKALISLRSNQNVKEELAILKDEDNLVQELHYFSLKSIIRNQVLTNSLVCCLLINVAQQMCGVNSAVYYSTEIYKQMKIHPQTAPFLTIGMSICAMVTTLVSVFIVDHCGRRILLRISLLGLAVGTTVTTLLFYLKDNVEFEMRYPAIVQVYVNFIMFSIGLGPIACFITAELFPHSTRTLAVCLSVAVNWLSNFLVGQAYLLVRQQLKAFALLIFVVLDVFFYLFVMGRLPETTKLSAIEILIFVTSVGSGFQHGFHTGVLNIPGEVIRKWIEMVRTEHEGKVSMSKNELRIIWSVTVAIFSLGGIIGAFLVGIFADRCGRKRSLKWNNIIILLAIILMAYSKEANDYKILILGRLVAGINAGLNAGICQIYLVEIAPDAIRGTIASVYQYAITCSIVISQVVGVFYGTDTNWPYMFVAAAIPAVMQLVALPFCPESPKFLLITKGQDKQAEDALKKLRGSQNVEEELETLKVEDNLVKQFREVSMRNILRNPKLTNALVCCLVLNIAQQMCGINFVIYFSAKLFKEMDLGTSTSAYLTIGMSTFATIITLVALLVVDFCGRRILLQISLLGMISVSLLMMVSICVTEQVISDMKYVSVILFYLFYGFHSVGLGAIPWFITAEMFPHNSRTLAVCLTVTINWLSNFLIGQAFLLLRRELGVYTHLIFVILDVFFCIFVWIHLPETTQVSATEMVKIYMEQ